MWFRNIKDFFFSFGNSMIYYVIVFSNDFDDYNSDINNDHDCDAMDNDDKNLRLNLVQKHFDIIIVVIMFNIVIDFPQINKYLSLPLHVDPTFL